MSQLINAAPLLKAVHRKCFFISYASITDNSRPLGRFAWDALVKKDESGMSFMVFYLTDSTQ